MSRDVVSLGVPLNSMYIYQNRVWRGKTNTK